MIRDRARGTMTMLVAGAGDYEKVREEQMKRNRERLMELNVAKLSATVSEKKVAARKATQRGVKRQKKSKSEPLVARRSLRVQGLKPSGEAIASETASGKVTLSSGATYYPVEPAKPSRKTGPVKFESVYEEDEDEARILDLLRSKSKPCKSGATTASAISELSLQEENCVKVTKLGAVHLGIMPRTDMTMVAAGDKEGRVGLWHLSETLSESDQVNLQVHPHTQYISGLKWCPATGRDLFTCSYDGVCRKLDLKEATFQEIYNSGDHEFSAFDVSCDSRSVYLSDNVGDFMVVDVRTSALAVKPFEMHGRKINTVHVDPGEGTLFTTSSTGGEVGVWDIRKVKKPVKMLSHPKSCQGSYFAPDGSHRILTTCYDDRLRVWDFKKNAETESFSILHNTHTGRWVLPFRAIWTPAADGVVCGSMKRTVNVYDGTTGKTIVRHSSDFLTAIPSRFFVHPTLPLLGASTSSGRIALFS